MCGRVSGRAEWRQCKCIRTRREEPKGFLVALGVQVVSALPHFVGCFPGALMVRICCSSCGAVSFRSGNTHVPQISPLGLIKYILFYLGIKGFHKTRYTCGDAHSKLSKQRQWKKRVCFLPCPYISLGFTRVPVEPCEEGV